MAPFNACNTHVFNTNVLTEASQSIVGVGDTTAVYHGEFEIFSQQSESEMSDTDHRQSDDDGVLQSGFGAGYRYRGSADVDEEYVPSDSDNDDPVPWYLPPFFNAYNRFEPVFIDLTADSDNEDSDIEVIPWNPLARRQRQIENGHVCMECEEVNRLPDTFISAVCRECRGKLCSSCCDDIQEATQSDKHIPPHCPYCQRGKQPYEHRQ